VRITRRTTIFFDASVLVAGAHSAGGGSALVLEACKRRGFVAQTTFLVIMEAYHALERNFPQASLVRFFSQLTEIDWDMLPAPPEDEMQQYASLVDLKDLHVLAAAAVGGSQFLLTLDRRHLLACVPAVEEAGLPIRILAPGDFIRQAYRLHEDFPSLPPPRG
jgi:predicted nucleic acid-binding protein